MAQKLSKRINHVIRSVPSYYEPAISILNSCGFMKFQNLETKVIWDAVVLFPAVSLIHMNSEMSEGINQVPKLFPMGTWGFVICEGIVKKKAFQNREL